MHNSPPPVPPPKPRHSSHLNRSLSFYTQNETEVVVVKFPEVLRIGGDILNSAADGVDLLRHHHPHQSQSQSQSSGGSGNSCVINGGGSSVVQLGTATTTSSESSYGKVSGGGVSRKSSKRPRPIHSRISRSKPPPKVQVLSEVEDLTHLSGPLTEDAILRALQARISGGKPYVTTGPILHLVNRLTSTNNPLTLNSTSEPIIPPPLKQVVQDAL